MLLIKAAIVDDEDECIHQLKTALDDWKQNAAGGCEIQVRVFKAGSDLLLSHVNEYHIIFLDIELDEEMNGVTAARKIRLAGYSGAIVFITGYQQYVFSGYKVNATDYIIKPVNGEKIEWCMNRVFAILSQGSFICRTKEEIRKIPYDQILYFQSALHYTDAITEKKKFHFKSSFKQLKKLLPSQFVQCHRTLIVNIWKIECINKKDILLSNEEVLPIGDSYLEEVRRMYIRRDVFLG